MNRLALAALLVLGLTGCASAPVEPSPIGIPAATGADRLADVCPDKVVIQQAWGPTADSAAPFQLLGPGYVVDAERKRVSGPLMSGGRDTGVRLEIRSGGAAIGFLAVPAQLYLDRSITLGEVHTDQAITTSGKQPVTAVVAPMTKSPRILMWDPGSHPDWRTVADIGASNALVLVSKDTSLPALLAKKWGIRPAQLDTGYTGAPARFIADPTIVQQGYVTNEPYTYQQEIKTWGKPVRYQLLADVGYSIYPQPLSVRTADLESLSGCLTKLVPALQRAQRDYLADPAPVNRLIVDAVAKFNTGVTYSPGLANHAVDTIRRLGLVANDSSGALGGLDPTRVQATIDTFAPLLRDGGAAVRPGLTSADIATNRFIDPAVRLD